MRVSMYRDALGLPVVLAWDEPTGAGVRVGTPDGVQLKFFTPQRPVIDGRDASGSG
jgi:hypothetical protein